MQTTLLKILHVPVLSLRQVSWILKLLCREDDRRQAIWTGWKHQVSILRMPNFTAWQEAEDEDAREARIAKTYKAKTPPGTILPQRFLYQEPSAPFSTMNRYWS